MSGPDAAGALLERALALLDAPLREALALRLGYHPQMLAMGVAGAAVGKLADAYRAALSDAADSGGVTDAALDLGPLVTRLQVVARRAVEGDPDVALLGSAALRAAVACALGELDAAGAAPARLPDDALAGQLRGRLLAGQPRDEAIAGVLENCRAFLEATPAPEPKAKKAAADASDDSADN